MLANQLPFSIEQQIVSLETRGMTLNKTHAEEVLRNISYFKISENVFLETNYLLKSLLVQKKVVILPPSIPQRLLTMCTMVGLSLNYFICASQ